MNYKLLYWILMHLLKFWHLPKKIWIPILLVIILVGGYFLWPKPKADPIETVEVSRGDVKSIISSSGTLEGTDNADLKFKIPGKLVQMNVQVGDRIEKGKLIASLDTRDLQIDLQQAYNTFEAKDAAAKRVEDDVKDKDEDEDFSDKEARTAAQKARDNAYDDIKSAKRSLEDAYIYAPIAGVVTKADPDVGQIVSSADLIAQIVDETEYIFEAEVDESDLGSVKPGQKADVSLNSYPDEVFNATVSEITPSTETTDSGATVVIVKLALGKPDINFVAGINGQADIVTNEAVSALVIPLDALMDESEVYVKRGDSYEKVKVETGLQSDTDVEVKSGLLEGDLVVTNPSAVKVNENSFKLPWQ